MSCYKLREQALQKVAKKFSKKYYKIVASVTKSLSKCHVKPRKMIKCK